MPAECCAGCTIHTHPSIPLPTVAPHPPHTHKREEEDTPPHTHTKEEKTKKKKKEREKKKERTKRKKMNRKINNVTVPSLGKVYIRQTLMLRLYSLCTPVPHPHKVAQGGKLIRKQRELALVVNIRLTYDTN